VETAAETARLREAPIGRRPIHAGRLISVFDDQVRLADGTLTHREVVEHPGAVAIVAIDGSGRIVLVRQWRHPVGRPLWEVPAGTRDRQEPPERTAERELEEETGLRARAWRTLGAWPLAPGYSTEVMHFYAAAELEAGGAHTDSDERIEVGRFSPAELRGLVNRADVDVKTIAGVALAGWGLTDG
jgi:ADP-ribose pyrophosphatase